MTALHAFCRELHRCNWNFKTGINWRTNKSWIHNVQCRTVSHCTISHSKVYVCLHHICIRYLIKPSKYHCPKYADEFTPTLPTSILLSLPIFTRKSQKKQPQSSAPSSMTRLCKPLWFLSQNLVQGVSVVHPGYVGFRQTWRDVSLWPFRDAWVPQIDSSSLQCAKPLSHPLLTAHQVLPLGVPKRQAEKCMCGALSWPLFAPFTTPLERWGLRSKHHVYGQWVQHLQFCSLRTKW